MYAMMDTTRRPSGLGLGIGLYLGLEITLTNWHCTECKVRLDRPQLYHQYCSKFHRHPPLQSHCGCTPHSACPPKRIANTSARTDWARNALFPDFRVMDRVRT